MEREKEARGKNMEMKGCRERTKYSQEEGLFPSHLRTLFAHVGSIKQPYPELLQSVGLVAGRAHGH